MFPTPCAEAVGVVGVDEEIFVDAIELVFGKGAIGCRQLVEHRKLFGGEDLADRAPLHAGGLCVDAGIVRPG